MKLKTLSNLKSKLIKLELIKSKIFQNYSDKFNFKNNFDQLEVYLKKALMIIFQYHLNNKKILFIGIPEKARNKHRQKLKKTKHLFLPESYWIKGLLTNKVTIFKYIKNRINASTLSVIKTKQVKNYFLLKKKPNLIVLFNSKFQSPIMKEAIKLKIPVIALNPKMRSDRGTLYKIPGNYDCVDKKNNNFFLLLLNSVLKKN